ncbi:hypothetical protein BDY24DRAFT_383759 [Mrakia frigida]|uniref:SMI1/KNR4 family protein n=1 Tax=Mrakia frigida TaxID=29902 RepID=UPI003FCC26D3
MSFFNNFTSLFTSSSNSSSGPSLAAHARQKSRGKAMRTTDDAFSLPTHDRPYGLSDPSRVSLGRSGSLGPDDSRPASPALPSNAFLHGRPDSPGPSRIHDEYSYPPRAANDLSSTGYDHVSNPALPSYGRTDSSSFVNDHDHSRTLAPHPHAAYPPLSHTWTRIKTFLAPTYPELVESLNFPTIPEELNQFELRLNMPLPASVRESYLCHDGQDLDGGVTDGMFFGLALLPLEEVLREWSFWRAVERDPSTGSNPRLIATMGSLPPKWCKRAYANRGWLPLISDRSGNYVGVDLDPGTGGEWGQVIVFGRDFDRKCVLWRGEGDGGWGRWLAGFADELESGEGWEVEGGGNDSAGSEDDIGHGGYFYSASGGDGGGDAYGERSGGMRLTGEYRGWNVMEAWFDRSARLWDEAGLLVGRDDDDDVLGGGDGGRGEASGGHEAEASGLGYGEIHAPVGLGSRSAVANGKLRAVEEEGRSSPQEPPNHPTLLVSTQLPSSHDGSSNSDRQLVSPLPTSNTASFMNNPDLLSPTPVKNRANQLPSPSLLASSTTSHPVVPLDLPTRSDVIASTAVAVAEENKLRGGWIMGPAVVDQVEDHRSSLEKKLPAEPGSKASVEAISVGMVDVDLEGGRGEKFGSNSGEGEGDGTLSPTGRRAASPFGFLTRRSQDGRSPSPLATNTTSGGAASPTTLPLPMSLPGTPPFVSAPSSPANPPSSTILLPPPPLGKAKSPLSSPLITAQFANLATPPSLGSVVAIPESPSTSTEEAADESFDVESQPTIRLVGGGAEAGDEEEIDLNAEEKKP